VATFPVIIVPLIFFIIAFSGGDRAIREQDVWVHYGDGAPPNYVNFYDEFAKYPDYAIAEYPINESYDARNDLKHLRKSIRQCRTTFGKAYRENKLRRTNPEDAYVDRIKFEVKPGWEYLLPFRPKYVVFAIRNNAEHTSKSTFATSYKVAYIIPTDLVFSEGFDFERALKSAYIDRSPFYFDAPSPEEEKTGWSPAERYKWPAIEQHEANMKKQAPLTEPSDPTNVAVLGR
jgi:hypothetical protein